MITSETVEVYAARAGVHLNLQGSDYIVDKFITTFHESGHPNNCRCVWKRLQSTQQPVPAKHFGP